MTAQNYQLLIWDGAKQKRINSESTELKLGKLSLAVLGDVEAAFAQEAADRATGDASTLASAQAYTDAEIAAASGGLGGDISQLQADLAQELLDRASGDSSTLSSAQSYTDQAISDLVGAAPSTLNTLKEIADAIANDASIAATLTASIASTQGEVDAVEIALASETAARQSADSAEQTAREAADNALDARLDDAELALGTSVVSLFENNAAAYADGFAGIQDPNFRAGWYFKNLVKGNKINWYFFDGTTENISLENFSAYAVVTFDSLVSKPHLAFYTTPTGSGDAAAWYKSRKVYVASGSPVAGTKYLMYFGQDPKVHPELPRLTMVDAGNSQGTLASNERVLTAVIGSDSNTSANNCQFVAEALGVFSPTIKRKIKLEIRMASKTALDAEATARASADTTLQSNINTVSASVTSEASTRSAAITALQGEVDAVEADLAQEILDRAAAVSAEQTRAESAESGLQGEIDAVESDLAQELLDRASADTTLQGNIDTVSSGLAQELLDRAAADTALQGEVDAVEADLAQELIDRAAAVSAVQAEVDAEEIRAAAAEAALQGEIDAVEGDLAQELLDRAAADTALQGAIDDVEADLAQELLDRAAADTALQGAIDDVAADLAQELLDRASAVSAVQGEVDALELVVADLKLISLVASEAISAGQVCYIKSNGEAAKAVATIDLSDAQLVVASASISSGASGKFYVVEGSVIGGFSSLTPGKKYFVSAATAGAVVANTTGFSAGNSVYAVGRAVSATQISFAPVFEFEY